MPTWTYFLFHSWRLHLPTPWFEISLALFAVLCGGIVGSERQKREKPAGMRTLILVSLGSACFTMASFIFTTSTGDSGRVSAQIVTGIGFLGAGVIMRGRGLITGATTAAMIWLTAATGVIVGAGYPFAALGVSILTRLVLGSVNMLEAHTLGKIPPIPAEIDFDPDHGKTRVRLQRIMADFNIPRNGINWTSLNDGSGLARLDLKIQLPAHHFLEMLDEIVTDPCVKAVRGLPEEAVEPKPKQVFN
ncbi:MAG TPA: MgtC/SapB family protein [Chthoniobacteraceae bacterium]|nr:MgtC/SapB family protein [Chthoniobacteraceae bacterium]